VELTIAVALMVIVVGAVVPLFRGIHNSWDTRQGEADLVQNGRVLIEHLRNQLAKSKGITSVSASTSTNGFIQFKGNDDLTYRYDIAADHYVEFGQTGSLTDLAGPVSTLKFSCYAADALTTPITDGNDIRLVKIETTLSNSAPMGHTQTWKTSVQLRCDLVPPAALVGWWRFNEASGLTAQDSSGYGYNGTLVNMTGNERTAGVLNKALAFDGSNDHVTLPIGSVIATCQSITVAAWVNFSTSSGSWVRIFDFGNDTTKNMYLTPRMSTSGAMRFAITTTGASGESTLTASATLPTGWHHVTVTIDGTTKAMKLYQDGSVVASGTSAKIPSDLGSTSKNYLGRSQYSADGYFQGSLDDFRIYNYVISSTQLGDLFAIGDMVQHLPFDESSGTIAYDNSGSYDGTLYNSPTWTTGYYGNCLNFDGVNDYVQSGRSVSYDMTLAAWIKTSSTAIGPQGNPTQWWDGECIIDADVGGFQNDFGSSDNRGKFTFGTGRAGVGETSVQSTSLINDGNWHHVLATRKGNTGEMKVYVDGVLQATGSGYSGYLTSPTSIRIGQMLSSTGSGTAFQGQIDDVRIYDRVLTADQIALLLE
jgi:hypothetical protein